MWRHFNHGGLQKTNRLGTAPSFPKPRRQTLVDSTINKISQEPDKEIHTLPSADASVNIGLPFKDQRSADRVRKDIYSLRAKIDVNIKPVFTSRKLSQTSSVKKNMPPIVNTQCVVYLFQCDLCDANWLCRVYCPTLRSTHKWTPLFSYRETHSEAQHGNNSSKIDHLFKVPRKCNSKFDCLVYEMTYIKNWSSFLLTHKPTPFAPTS